MRQNFVLCVTVFLALAYQCAAQGHGATTAKMTYAHSRDFNQYVHGLHKDPLVLVAFIAAVLSGATLYPTLDLMLTATLMNPEQADG